MWRRIRSDVAQENEGGANERLGCCKQSNRNRQAPHDMVWGKQTKRKHDQADYEEPQRRTARNPVRELNNGVEGGSSGKPSSIAKRPLIAAAGARARRSDSRAPQDDSNRERENKPCVCSEALLGRHYMLKRILIRAFL
jgi:hypothetical protein